MTDPNKEYGLTQPFAGPGPVPKLRFETLEEAQAAAAGSMHLDPNPFTILQRDKGSSDPWVEVP